MKYALSKAVFLGGACGHLRTVGRSEFICLQRRGRPTPGPRSCAHVMVGLADPYLPVLVLSAVASPNPD